MSYEPQHTDPLVLVERLRSGRTTVQDLNVGLGKCTRRGVASLQLETPFRQDLAVKAFGEIVRRRPANCEQSVELPHERTADFGKSGHVYANGVVEWEAEGVSLPSTYLRKEENPPAPRPGGTDDTVRIGAVVEGEQNLPFYLYPPDCDLAEQSTGDGTLLYPFSRQVPTNVKLAINRKFDKRRPVETPGHRQQNEHCGIVPLFVGLYRHDYSRPNHPGQIVKFGDDTMTVDKRVQRNDTGTLGGPTKFECVDEHGEVVWRLELMMVTFQTRRTGQTGFSLNMHVHPHEDCNAVYVPVVFSLTQPGGEGSYWLSPIAVMDGILVVRQSGPTRARPRPRAPRAVPRGHHGASTSGMRRGRESDDAVSDGDDAASDGASATAATAATAVCTVSTVSTVVL